MSNNTGIITYGFGREYLKNWGLKQAMREVYQNFIDFGEYSETITRVQTRSGVVLNVTLMNKYEPETLRFLRIGNSDKNDNKNAIGKHGEGLKMAAMIFAREEIYFELTASGMLVLPKFIEDEQIGECFAFEYKQLGYDTYFYVSFDVDERMFEEFKSGILTEDNHSIIYKHETYGNIIDRSTGQIYVGGIYVCDVNGLRYAYDFKPSFVHLDRDRAVPSSFDVNWTASQILMEYQKQKPELAKAIDLNYNDYQYINQIPKSVMKNITPQIVGNEVVFIAKDKDATGKETQVVITNHSAKEILKNDSIFSKIIRKLKEAIFKGLGVYELMENFRKKYVDGNTEMEHDFDIIMQKYKDVKVE